MADELWNTLLKFHREVAAPEIVGPLREEIASGRGEMLSHFDGVYKRFDRLESEYYALSAAVKRLEEKLGS
jgi:hypothetical protein